MTPSKKELQKLATSKWIDELSEEEIMVLKKSHALDKRLANKLPVLV